MRDDTDITLVRIVLSGTISLDWERIEADPAWVFVTAGMDLSDPEDRKQALFKYIGAYLSRQLLLTDCPSTNGPGQVWPIEMEVVSGG